MKQNNSSTNLFNKYFIFSNANTNLDKNLIRRDEVLQLRIFLNFEC